MYKHKKTQYFLTVVLTRQKPQVPHKYPRAELLYGIMSLMDRHFPLNAPFTATHHLSFLLNYIRMPKTSGKCTLRNKITVTHLLSKTSFDWFRWRLRQRRTISIFPLKILKILVRFPKIKYSLSVLRNMPKKKPQTHNT